MLAEYREHKGSPIKRLLSMYRITVAGLEIIAFHVGETHRFLEFSVWKDAAKSICDILA